MIDEWQKNQMFVLSELKRLNDNIEKMLTENATFKTDLALIKERFVMLGMLCGFLGSFFTPIAEWLINRVK